MIHLPTVTIFFAIYMMFAIVTAFLCARNNKSKLGNGLVTVLIVVGGIDVLGGLAILNSSGWFDGLLFASGPLSAALLFLGFAPLYLHKFHPHLAKNRPRKPQFGELAVAATAVVVFSLICWAHAGNVLRSFATARFAEPIRSSASILGEFLKGPSTAPDGTGKKLVPNRYIIVEQLDSAGIPDSKHLTISRFSSGFPVARNPKDVDEVVVVLGQQHTVREYMNTGSDYQWSFSCFLVDLKSNSIVADSRAFYGSVPIGRAGQPNGGQSSSGDQPWNDVRKWLETLE